jgi:stearoyl-CoA desaturase (delta-9 desaturase)
VSTAVPKFQPSWRKLVPYAMFHVAAVAGACLVGARPRDLALFGVLYVVRVMGATLGYHRYFSQRAFKTSRPVQLVVGLWANLSYMRGPIVWASHHRYHHQHADTEADLHSPRHRGFWFAHTGWFGSREYDETRLIDVKDREEFPELVRLDRHHDLAPGRRWEVDPTCYVLWLLAKLRVVRDLRPAPGPAPAREA